jgi:hypothetical protein
VKKAQKSYVSNAAISFQSVAIIAISVEFALSSMIITAPGSITALEKAIFQDSFSF